MWWRLARQRPKKKGQAGTKKRGKKRKKGVASGYCLFRKHVQEHVPGALEGLSFAEASKKVGAMWRALDLDEKSVFNDQSKRLKIERAVEDGELELVGPAEDYDL